MPEWTEIEVAWLKTVYAGKPTSEIAQALGRSKSSIKNKVRELGLRKSVNSTRFKSGQTPWNKGRPFNPGGRSAETRFKPGNKPQTWVPVGTEATDPKDGYLKRKVRDDKVPSRFNWSYVHRLVWEERHGPIPNDHAVIFLDGDRTNITIENLGCISRTELGQRNGMWNRYPRPVAEVMHLRGQLKRRIRERSES